VKLSDMRAYRKRIGDIYYNPLFRDLWVLYWGENEDMKETWLLQLIGDDYKEEFKYVEGFIKIGNIYDLCCDKMLEMGLFDNE